MAGPMLSGVDLPCQCIAVDKCDGQAVLWLPIGVSLLTPDALHRAFCISEPGRGLRFAWRCLCRVANRRGSHDVEVDYIKA